MTSAAAAPTDALPDTAQRIVLAAEREFAERGFDGAGMKAISQRAEVSQALLHYHFGNKDHLYSEVIRRRSKLINEEREALLGAVDLGGPGAVAGILDALFRPPLGPAGGDQAYTRIFGGLVVGRERERALAALCYTLSLGALVVVIARDGRVERLMGREAVQGMEEMLAHLITYASGGIAALTGGAPG